MTAINFIGLCWPSTIFHDKDISLLFKQFSIRVYGEKQIIHPKGPHYIFIKVDCGGSPKMAVTIIGSSMFIHLF